jgi:putative nucleotidyltransferase with HDIG domain
VKAIKDAVHGTITLSDVETALLDTPQMQRLRRIRQLVSAYLVYPGANHTRFEHSLGTMHMAGAACDALALGEEQKQGIRIAGLLHDVGHCAFSHEGEEMLRQLGDHERFGAEKIRKSGIADVLAAHGYGAAEIAALATGKGLGQIVTSDLGADRMDYLLRDAHYTGAAYGVIDAERLVRTLRLRRGRLLLDAGGIEAAEALLIARFLMMSTVYFHHAVRIASAMIGKAISIGLRDGTIEARALLEEDDSSLAFMLMRNATSAALLERLRDRRLLKRAYELPLSALSESGRKRLEKDAAALERGVSDACGLGEGGIVIDVPKISKKSFAVEARVLVGGSAMPLARVSRLAHAIAGTEKNRWNVIVACDKKDKENVAKACKREFAGFVK